MKITGNEPINARPYSHDERPSGGFEGDRPETFQAFKGLTIRQYYTGLAMQGFLATDTEIGGKLGNTAKDIAQLSVKVANALIEELNKIEE